MRPLPPLAAILLALAGPVEAQAPVDLRGPAGAPAPPGTPFRPTGLPDRLLLVPGADPSRDMAVSFRTDAAQAETLVELIELKPAPNFGLAARRVAGASTATISENGPARHHQARLSGLAPATRYAWRAKGSAGWSEWHQFMTAAAPATPSRPFRFLYLGDLQNDILSLGSLAVRRALLQGGDPVLIVHAGDLVNGRETKVTDDEWGEWAAAFGWALAAIPQLAAAGNHEYMDRRAPDGRETRVLGGHWPLMFPVPANGAPGTEPTTYAVDWQGVRFLVLDGTSALDLGTLDAQTAWLEAQLRRPKAGWTVIVFHQPIFTCARPRDTPRIGAAWVPLFERFRVDLVLQGHDHCYSRLTAAEGKAASAARTRAGRPQGPVYMVSVAGSKMYGLNDRADTQPDRVAEDTMLFQTVDVTPARLQVRSFTADGRLYDGFDLVRQRDGSNRLVEMPGLPATRRCAAGRNADGLPCTARPR